MVQRRWFGDPLTTETGKVVNPILLDLSRAIRSATCSRKPTAIVQCIAGTTRLFLTIAEFTIGIPLLPSVVSRPRFGCLMGAYWSLLEPSDAHCDLSKYMITCF
jgi:hypothetical protein